MNLPQRFVRDMALMRYRLSLSSPLIATDTKEQRRIMLRISYNSVIREFRLPMAYMKPTTQGE